MEGGYFINFLTIVQLAVAFCLGMIFMDRKSAIVVFQSSIFDNLRKNGLACFIMNYAGGLTKYIKTNSVPTYVSEYREELNTLKYEYRAALDTERTCRFMAAVGTIAGLYSIGWLFYVPYFIESSDSEYVYIFLSCSLATIVVLLLCMLLDIFTKLISNRVNCAFMGFFMWVVSLTIAICFYQNGWCINVHGSAKELYGWCVAICFVPIWALLVRIFSDILRRIILIVGISKRTCLLKLWKLKCPGVGRIIQLRTSHPKWIIPLRVISFIFIAILVLIFGILYYMFILHQWLLKHINKLKNEPSRLMEI